MKNTIEINFKSNVFGTDGVDTNEQINEFLGPSQAGQNSMNVSHISGLTGATGASNLDQYKIAPSAKHDERQMAAELAMNTQAYTNDFLN